MEKSYNELKELYNSTYAGCRVCGCTLKSMFGDPLGNFFVLDKCGHFYCIDCDVLFEDGDEEIFDLDLCEEEDCDD